MASSGRSCAVLGGGILAALSKRQDLQEAKYDKCRDILDRCGRSGCRHSIFAGNRERDRSVG